jgi:hypothetical protein
VPTMADAKTVSGIALSNGRGLWVGNLWLQQSQLI